MLSLVAMWGIPALVRTNGEFFNIGIGRHVVARSVVAMEGHGAASIWSYLATLPFYFVLDLRHLRAVVDQAAVAHEEAVA